MLAENTLVKNRLINPKVGRRLPPPPITFNMAEI